jgi:hypothetical protein
MAPQFLRYTHGLQIPDHNSTVNTTRGEVVAFPIETKACRMTGTDGVRDILRIVLEQIVVGKQQIHIGVFMLVIKGG